MPFQQTTFDNTYQTMPETRWNYWNLIKFNEHQREDGTLQWLMRKDQCMHCADPGLPARLPGRRRDRAVHQRHRRFPAGELHRLRVLRLRLPVQHSEVQSRRRRRFTSARCAPIALAQGLEPACIKACPTGCLQFGTKDDMKYIAEKRAKQLREHSGFKNAGVYDPADRSAARTSSTCCTTPTNPERYGGLPKNPRIPLSYTVWKDWFKPLGLFASMMAFAGVVLHYVTEGPRRLQPQPPVKGIDGGEARKEN